MEKETLIKIIVLGDKKVGKTNIIRRFNFNTFDKYYYSTNCKY